MTKRTSISSYLTELQNTVIAIWEIFEDEKLEKFCSGLKPQVKLEILKSNLAALGQATQIAFSMTRTIFGTGIYHSWGMKPSFFSNSGPQPTESENFEKCLERNKGNTFLIEKTSEQRHKDLQHNAYFTCHESGCIPGKHRNVEKKVTEKNLAQNNAQIAVKYDSENE